MYIITATALIDGLKLYLRADGLLTKHRIYAGAFTDPAAAVAQAMLAFPGFAVAAERITGIHAPPTDSEGQLNPA